MVKMISIVLFGLILHLDYYAQQKIFGYKISGNGDIISDAFLIQEGFILDSATVNNKTYLFEYDEKGKIKRDINFITYADPYNIKYKPGCRDYFYNVRGDIDSILYGKWNDSLQVYDYTGSGIKYYYDNEGKIISRTSNNGITTKLEENSYDSYGNLILNKITAGGDTTYNFREYDSQNRLILTKSIHNSSTYYDQQIYKYDSSGNIDYRTYLISPNYIFNAGNKYLVFDESGKVVNEIHRSFNSTDSTWVNNFEILFNYDENGRILKMGESAWFHYNADGNLDTLVNPLVPSNGGYLSSRATLIDSYDNEIRFPDYKGFSYFYYSELITGIENNEITGKTFTLLQNYPNPFNPRTKITYSIAQTSFVSLKVYDLLGKGIATLVNEEKPIGIYVIDFDGSNLVSGVYFYRIQAGNVSDTKKLILLR